MVLRIAGADDPVFAPRPAIRPGPADADHHRPVRQVTDGIGIGGQEQRGGICKLREYHRVGVAGAGAFRPRRPVDMARRWQPPAAAAPGLLRWRAEVDRRLQFGLYCRAAARSCRKPECLAPMGGNRRPGAKAEGGAVALIGAPRRHNSRALRLAVGLWRTMVRSWAPGSGLTSDTMAPVNSSCRGRCRDGCAGAGVCDPSTMPGTGENANPRSPGRLRGLRVIRCGRRRVLPEMIGNQGAACLSLGSAAIGREGSRE
jgi:hypothetical protein